MVVEHGSSGRQRLSQVGSLSAHEDGRRDTRGESIELVRGENHWIGPVGGLCRITLINGFEEDDGAAMKCPPS